MRFPSLAFLAERALAVLRRFPWTIAAGVLAAVCAVAASLNRADDDWVRVAFVAALGLPATVALALLGEAKGWTARARAAAGAATFAALAVFLAAWPGPDRSHDALRYFQLSAALHLAVAFLPFLGTAETNAFWQYNRRLFLGFLRAAVFSVVIFAGTAVALGALDKLFGVDVPFEVYLRLWLVVAFVVNTWIFLAAVPGDLAALAHDGEYPRGLKIFAQYVLTPLAFAYLVILLAYLVKIVAGGEWPSGWIGWLVGSVAVTGLLGFLLVHPLRDDPGEGWIRTYARWLFVGLVPASLMLLAAFWKRILPYGLTEPRTLGIVLGLWLLAIATFHVVRRGAGIRIIPVTLAGVLALTLYGPLGATRLSIGSQGRRLERMLAAGPAGEAPAEASAAIRWLLDRRATKEIAARTGQTLPPLGWDTLPRWSAARDSVAARIITAAGGTYVPEYMRTGDMGSFYLGIGERDPMAVTGYDWVLAVGRHDGGARTVGGDSLLVLDDTTGTVRILVGADTLAFDLRPLARRWADSMPRHGMIPAESLRVTAAAGPWRGQLSVNGLNGTRAGDSLAVSHWNGWLLLGRDTTP